MRRVLVSVSLLALAACKGGGTVSFGGPPLVDPNVLATGYVTDFAPYEAIAANLRTNISKYTIQLGNWGILGAPGVSSYPLASARAEYAHAVGLTGAGQIVQVVDGGFLQSHDVFQGKTIYTPGGGLGVADHGTSVAAVATGNSPTMIGIAPGADLALGEFWSEASLAAATQQATALGAVAQNNSWGYVGTPINTNSFNQVFGTTDGASYLAALDAYAAQGVVVFAISNTYGDTTSGLMEALPKLRPSLEGGWLAVGNAAVTYDANGITGAARVSAGCLDAARWCLMAEGRWQSAVSTGNSAYAEVVGSSFAAPQVAGALALLAEAFPNLTPHDLRARLLASADNSFFTPTATVQLANGYSHGYNSEFGHGFLDIRAALLPIGKMTMALPNGQSVSPNQPVMVAGAALGDAVQRSLGQVDVAITDALSGQFSMPGQFLAANASPRPLGDAALTQALRLDLGAARQAPVSALADPFAGFDGQSVELASLDGDLGANLLVPAIGGDTPSYGATLHTALADDGATKLELGLKLARDNGRLLGLGAEGQGGAGLASLSLGLSHDMGAGGFLSLTGEAGIADLGTAQGLSDVSQARFSSFDVTFGQRDLMTDGDKLAFGLSLPVAVTSGRAEAVLPVARGRSVASFEPVAIDLAPGSRQVDLSVSYQQPLAPGLELMTELVHSENYGNRAGARDTAGVLALQWRF